MFEAVGIATYFLAASVAQMANPLGTYPPIDSMTGLDSKVERVGAYVARNQDQWDSIWQMHISGPWIGAPRALPSPDKLGEPKIDFNTSEVVAVFGGLDASSGFKVVDSERVTKGLRVRLQRLPQLTQSGQPSLNPPLLANPYLFLTFPKTKLRVEIQVETVDSSGTVQWKTLAIARGI